jgi:hypothetical protein
VSGNRWGAFPSHLLLTHIFLPYAHQAFASPTKQHSAPEKKLYIKSSKIEPSIYLSLLTKILWFMMT